MMITLIITAGLASSLHMQTHCSWIRNVPFQTVHFRALLVGLKDLTAHIVCCVLSLKFLWTLPVSIRPLHSVDSCLLPWRDYCCQLVEQDMRRMPASWHPCSAADSNTGLTSLFSPLEILSGINVSCWQTESLLLLNLHPVCLPTCHGHHRSWLYQCSTF